MNNFVIRPAAAHDLPAVVTLIRALADFEQLPGPDEAAADRLAADFVGLWRSRRWFIGATATSGFILLLGLNVANPEAIVVAFNTNHAQTAHKIDSEYLAELSSDATPALLASRDQLELGLRQQVTDTACRGDRSYSPPLAAYNWADAAAAEARRSSC